MGMEVLVNRKVWAIIVTFNPDTVILRKLVSQLVAQESWVVIVNNGKQDLEINKMISETVYLIQLPSNQGIAKAQNDGILFAKKHGAMGIFLFDQDSQIPDHYVQSFLDYNYIPKVGMLVPQVLDVNKNDYLEPRIYDCKNGEIYVDFPAEKINSKVIRKAAKPIASGSFIFMSAINFVGGMREDFFIDAIDTDFSFRLIENGFDVFQLKNVVLNHEVGNKVMKNILGYSLYLSNHNPQRRYYIGRNNVWLWKIHHKEIKGVSKDVFITLCSQLVYTVLEQGTFRKLFQLFYGIISGILLHPSKNIREI